MKKGNWLTYIAIFAIVGLLFNSGSCGQKQAPTIPAGDIVTVTAPVPEDNPAVSEQSMTLRVQLAETEEEQGAGLSGFPGLPSADSENNPVHGMLYVYDEAAPRRFYESATGFPLSTATLADDGTILEIKKTGPGPDQEQEIAFEQPARFVLQVRRNWFADRNLGAGDRLELPPAAHEVPAAPFEEAPADTGVEPDTRVQ